MFVYKKEKPSLQAKSLYFSSTNERYKSELYSPAAVACRGRRVHAKLKKHKGREAALLTASLASKRTIHLVVAAV